MQLPSLPSPTAYDIAEKSQETMDWLRNNIKVGFTSERGPAWWASQEVQLGLPDGSHFDGPVPIEEVKKLLDIKLIKGVVHITYEDEDGNRQVVADERTAPILNQRTGQVFSYPKEGYKIHPYLETLHGFIEQITDDSDVAVGSVGLLKKGGVAFLQAVLPEDFEVAGYGYQPYLTAVTSADKSRATTFVTGFKGAVCDNTVDAAIYDALTKLRIPHTKKSELRVQTARDSLGLRLAQTGEQVGSAIEALTKVDVSPAEFEKWLELECPIPEKDPKSSTGGRGYTMATERRGRLTELWTSDEKVAPWKGTAFGVLQLDNTDRTWNSIVRSAQGGRLERNLTNDVLGLTGKADVAALELLGQVKGLELV